MLDYKQTQDNSNTLYSSQYGEHYHSLREGALSESFNKHINPAFNHILDKNITNINILDICFGLGYNILASIYYMEKNTKNVKLNILSIELDKKLVSSLVDFEYPEIFKPYKNIILSLVENGFYNDDRINIRIIYNDVRCVIKKLDTKFNIVYQDAFSYTKNPTLWTYEYFRDIKKLLDKDCILTTYSISTKIRLALSENGFFIYENILDKKHIGTLGFLEKIDNKKHIDMEEKKKRSSIKKPLYDDTIDERELKYEYN